VAGTFAAQMSVGQPPQLRVYHRRKLFERALVALIPIDE